MPMVSSDAGLLDSPQVVEAFLAGYLVVCSLIDPLSVVSLVKITWCKSVRVCAMIFE